MVIMDVRGDFLVKKRPFKQYLGKNCEIQQPEKPETRTSWIICFGRASVLSKKPTCKIGSKWKKNSTFWDKLWPRKVKNSYFGVERWDHQLPYDLSNLGIACIRRRESRECHHHCSSTKRLIVKLNLKFLSQFQLPISPLSSPQNNFFICQIPVTRTDSFALFSILAQTEGSISLFMVFSTILNQGIAAGMHIQIIWKMP